MATIEDALGALGATQDGETDVLWTVHAKALNIEGLAAGPHTVEVFSDETIAFRAPSVLAALGTLWVKPAEEADALAVLVADAAKKLFADFDAVTATLESYGAQCQRTAATVSGRTTIAGFAVRVEADHKGALRLVDVGGRAVPQTSQALSDDVRAFSEDAFERDVRQIVADMEKAGFLEGRGLFDARTDRAFVPLDSDAPDETAQAPSGEGASSMPGSPSSEGRARLPRPRRRASRSATPSQSVSAESFRSEEMAEVSSAEGMLSDADAAEGGASEESDLSSHEPIADSEDARADEAAARRSSEEPESSSGSGSEVSGDDAESVADASSERVSAESASAVADSAKGAAQSNEARSVDDESGEAPLGAKNASSAGPSAIGDAAVDAEPSDDAKSSESKSSEADSSAAESSDAKSAESKSSEADSSAAESSEAKSSESASSEADSSEAESSKADASDAESDENAMEGAASAEDAADAPSPSSERNAAAASFEADTTQQLAAESKSNLLSDQPSMEATRASPATGPISEFDLESDSDESMGEQTLVTTAPHIPNPAAAVSAGTFAEPAGAFSVPPSPAAYRDDDSADAPMMTAPGEVVDGPSESEGAPAESADHDAFESLGTAQGQALSRSGDENSQEELERALEDLSSEESDIAGSSEAADDGDDSSDEPATMVHPMGFKRGDSRTEVRRGISEKGTAVASHGLSSSLDASSAFEGGAASEMPAPGQTDQRGGGTHASSEAEGEESILEEVDPAAAPDGPAGASPSMADLWAKSGATRSAAGPGDDNGERDPMPAPSAQRTLDPDVTGEAPPLSSSADGDASLPEPVASGTMPPATAASPSGLAAVDGSASGESVLGDGLASAVDDGASGDAPADEDRDEASVLDAASPVVGPSASGATAPVEAADETKSFAPDPPALPDDPGAGFDDGPAPGSPPVPPPAEAPVPGAADGLAANADGESSGDDDAPRSVSAESTFNVLQGVVGDGIATGKTGAFELDAQAFGTIAGSLDEDIKALSTEEAALMDRLSAVRDRLLTLKKQKEQARDHHASLAARDEKTPRMLAANMAKVRGETVPSASSRSSDPQIAPAIAAAALADGIALDEVAAVLGAEGDDATQMIEGGFAFGAQDDDDDDDDVFGTRLPASSSSRSAFPDAATRVAPSPLEVAVGVGLVVLNASALARLEKHLSSRLPRVTPLASLNDAVNDSSINVGAYVFVRPKREETLRQVFVKLKARTPVPVIIVLSDNPGFDKDEPVDRRVSLPRRTADVANAIVDVLKSIGISRR